MDALTKGQLLAILKRAYGARERDGLMVLVAYSHGLRASEVVAIKRNDIESGCLTVRRLKGSLRTVQLLVADENPLLDEATRLFEFVRNLHGNQRVFPVTRRQFGRLFERYCALSGIPRRLAHPHILKHTLAMQIIDKAGIHNTRQYLGHKSMNSTSQYLKLTDAEAAAAVGRALKG